MQQCRETAQAVCREHKISEQTFHRWEKQYGDMELADAKRPKERQKQNAELQKMLEMHVLAQVVHLAVAVEAAEAKTV